MLILDHASSSLETSDVVEANSLRIGYTENIDLQYRVSVNFISVASVLVALLTRLL